MERTFLEKVWIVCLLICSFVFGCTVVSRGEQGERPGAPCRPSLDYDSRGDLMEKLHTDSLKIGFDSEGYGFGKDSKGLKPYVLVSASALQSMAGVAARWGNIETGGELYGLLTHAGRPVIMLATSPSPNAIQEVARFTQDIDLFKKTDAFLRDTFGLQYLGNYHSHHTLNIRGLSPGDIRSTHAIASKNGYQRFAQFVLTFEKGLPSNRSPHSDQAYGQTQMELIAEVKAKGRSFTDLCGKVKSRFVPSRPIIFIRIHSFMYFDAARGEPIRCPIKILPGTNPFKRVIERNTLIPELAILYTFPMSQVLFDSLDPSSESKAHDSELPSTISGQWFQLPEEVQKGSRATFKEGMIVLSLPLPAKGRLFVEYNDRPPYRVAAVYYSSTEKAAKPINLSEESLCCGPHTELARIYERIVHLSGKQGPPMHSGGERKTGEAVKLQNEPPAEEEPISEREPSKRGGDIS